MGWGGSGKGAPRATPTGESYFGIIESSGAKFGFIKCRPVEAKYGTDVFATSTSLQGFNIGDKVDFEVGVNEKGQPQALNVRGKGGGKGRDSGAGASYGGGGGCGGGCSKGGGKGGSKPMGSFFGHVETIGPKYGFIKCPPVFAEFGNDVFCPSAGLRGLSVGDKVDFELTVNQNGQPQAEQVRSKGYGKGMDFGGGCDFGGKGGGMVQGKPAGRNFRGVVKSIGSKFGFIESKAVFQEHNSDVFAPIQELMACAPGEEVTFDLFISKDKPRAANVVPSGVLNPGAGKATSTGECHTGTVKKTGGKFGFITCEALGDRFGGIDIFAPCGALQGFNIGDAVTFELFVNAKGQPQAGMLTRAGKNTAAPAGETHVGVVSATGSKFGFIDCEATKAKYNVDVFCPAGLLVGMAKGVQVSFELGLGPKGQPQALSVTATEGSAAKKARLA
mmetsp:Transcript_10779/g.28826  ORF Transcript_10779/g.28826 Transcript_10779/m.28826 type:complete len:446 (+) Transcript_10779:74-1411(+)